MVRLVKSVEYMSPRKIGLVAEAAHEKRTRLLCLVVTVGES